VPFTESASQWSRYSPRVILAASKISPPSLSAIALVSLSATAWRVLP
jgi:hypothetical protein